MKLPRDLLSGKYIAPRFFLCETDKTKICQLDVYNANGTFKFNSLSEISFKVDRTYNDFLEGQNKVNPFYNKIEALRLIFVEGFGYFEIQGPKVSSDGIQETKEITAYSLEYTLSQKYLSNFYINTGEIGSVEVTYSEEHNTGIIPVTLYNPTMPQLSLLNLILEKVYGWSIGHVDEQLKTLGRTFEVDRQSIYDFIMNEICSKFNCYVVFDTINNTINFYAESSVAKFIGDGDTNTFIISPPFYDVDTVSIYGYKTTQWSYNASTGAITFINTPSEGSHIEVVDKSLKPWETDVCVSFENLSDTIDISYDADDIKTVLTVTYGEDNDIREANLGLPYLTDISYYYTVDWMGQELYDAYTLYLQKSNAAQLTYTKNSEMMQDLAGYIDFEQHRLSLGYAISQVSSTTVGTYYVKGGIEPQYYYTEVSLPSDYNANLEYYRIDTANLSETKVSDLYNVFKEYFSAGTNTELEKKWLDDYNALANDFKFMESNFEALKGALVSVLPNNRTNNRTVEAAMSSFLNIMWNEVGKEPLKSLYYETYKKVQVTNLDAGWSNQTNENYPNYYPVTIMLKSIEKAIQDRDLLISEYQNQYNDVQQENIEISNSLLLSNNFTEKQLVRLNSFLREDELKVEDIVETELDNILDTFKNKQHAMEAGRIELQKISEPKLSFSMTMANIYAIPEFEPIIHQFQLGNVVKVKLRDDYIKQSRLLQVDINFDNLDDFSATFGDLTNLRTQSDIHADLLASAINAGKQVATNSSYWTKGTDKANSIDLRLQQGLLDTVEALKATDGTQNSYIDKYGLHLESVDPSTGEVSPKKVWMVNDKIVFTDDDFRTSKSVLGEYTIDGESRWGLITEYVNAGLVEGSKMIGGTIKIGEQADGSFAFEVHEDGSVTMGAGDLDGYVTQDEFNSVAEFEKSLGQYLKFDPTTGLKIGQDDEKFYVLITAGEMGFYDNSNSTKPNDKVVSIGSNSATIKDLKVEDEASFNCPTSFRDEIKLFGNFVLKKEDDGGMSLIIAK